MKFRKHTSVKLIVRLGRVRNLVLERSGTGTPQLEGGRLGRQRQGSSQDHFFLLLCIAAGVAHRSSQLPYRRPLTIQTRAGRSYFPRSFVNVRQAAGTAGRTSPVHELTLLSEMVHDRAGSRVTSTSELTL